MFNSTGNKKGITMVEVVIAIFLVGFGILALVSLLPSAWRLAGQSDNLGRATGILESQLHEVEAQVLNPSVSIASIPVSATGVSVNVSGQGTLLSRGDAAFTVRRTITQIGATNSYTVWVQVAWPGNPTGIRESLIVARQPFDNPFDQP